MSAVKVKFEGNLSPSQYSEFVKLVSRFQKTNQREVDKDPNHSYWDDSFLMEVQKPINIDR